MVTRATLVIGGKYNWKNQPERLQYVGKHMDHPRCAGWYQFSKVGETAVWCEVRESDLSRFEESK
jgi:hypothetical protein